MDIKIRYHNIETDEEISTYSFLSMLLQYSDEFLPLHIFLFPMFFQKTCSNLYSQIIVNALSAEFLHLHILSVHMISSGTYF